ncbi:MAG: glycosyltransferase [Deltaproteobacteria bacterium]|nr:glycosyltransferase [Deltaproteobacteria bacterium]NCP97217.1 glycosyltransferase [Deltaproteobacteria bacterium]NCS74332.1 glycosyltransferase [Deltaproteobacteria bacterium]PJB95301.1 MAG: beta-(1-3)-glucosyl transferase [Nitrospirae bacterium CG_4_9_14_0_8_um_filter_70_14]
MSRYSILITVSLALLTLSLWAVANRPEEEPPWPARIQGFSFSPYRAGQSPFERTLPSAEEIDADLALLAGKSHAVRTYAMEGTLAEVPRLARKHGINVTVGAWITGKPDADETEVTRLIEVAEANRHNVVRAIVGNEALLRGDLNEEQLIPYLERVRQAVAIPVSTAEPWHVWLKHRALADHVDFIAVHMLPYWEGIDLEVAVDYVVRRVKELEVAFPGKPIVIAEVGWPSNGRTRHAAVASDANEAIFLRRFLARAVEEKYIYYVMEAFDQPWKHVSEGAVGAYWGVYDVQRRPKFAFTEPVVEVPEWRILAAVSVVIAAVVLAFLFTDSRTLRRRGRNFLAVVAYVAATTAVWVVYQYSQQYLTVASVTVGFLLLAGMVGVMVLLFTEAHEWAEALWFTERRRAFRPVVLAQSRVPRVSIHVPAYNEPPEMLIETLNALARLDYPDYEVVVVDNNTVDPAVWEPVRDHCARLGERFRFFHVAPLAGFKAGALNFALAHTDPHAEIVAVIDSDYTVHPRWLRDLCPQFERLNVAIVQAPQNYRDVPDNAFKAMCYAEYRGFFFIGMVTRNERNAIIQHGTMTLVRRRTLEDVGGWGEWCITEDAELGLRVFEAGYEATYIPCSYGRGLMPDTFVDFQKQRFRWAYGAMQILRHHAGELFGFRPTHLSRGQRYHFVSGWLPWLADGCNLLFNLAALVWSLGMIYAPHYLDPPMMAFSALPLVLFAFKGAKLLYLYRTGVRATVRQTVAAAVAGLALSHTIARAVLSGLVTRNQPFFRTPKLAHGNACLRALVAAREEGLLMIALGLAAYILVSRQGTGMPDLVVWVAVLIIQAVPYTTAVIMALISGLPRLPAALIGPPGELDRECSPSPQPAAPRAQPEPPAPAS